MRRHYFIVPFLLLLAAQSASAATPAAQEQLRAIFTSLGGRIDQYQDQIWTHETELAELRTYYWQEFVVERGGGSTSIELQMMDIETSIERSYIFLNFAWDHWVEADVLLMVNRFDSAADLLQRATLHLLDCHSWIGQQSNGLLILRSQLFRVSPPPTAATTEAARSEAYETHHRAAWDASGQVASMADEARLAREACVFFGATATALIEPDRFRAEAIGWRAAADDHFADGVHDYIDGGNAADRGEWLSAYALYRSAGRHWQAATESYIYSECAFFRALDGYVYWLENK